MKVYKYELKVQDEQTLMMPDGPEPLFVGAQNGVPCLWARVAPELPMTSRRIFTHGTGHDIHPDAGEHIGSYMLRNGELVFHVSMEARPTS